jgi:hypothetical protein
MGPCSIPIFNIVRNSVQPDIRVSTLSCYVHYTMPVASNCDNAIVKDVSMKYRLQELKHITITTQKKHFNLCLADTITERYNATLP